MLSAPFEGPCMQVILRWTSKSLPQAAEYKNDLPNAWKEAVAHAAGVIGVAV